MSSVIRDLINRAEEDINDANKKRDKEVAIQAQSSALALADRIKAQLAAKEKANEPTVPINDTPDTIGKSEQGADLSFNISNEPSTSPTVATDEEFFRKDNPVAYATIDFGVVGLGTLAYFVSQ
jgi:hypothetical protein